MEHFDVSSIDAAFAGADTSFIHSLPAPAEEETLARPPVAFCRVSGDPDGITCHLFRVSDRLAERLGVLPLFVLGESPAGCLALSAVSSDGRRQLVVHSEEEKLVAAAPMFPGHVLMKLVPGLEGRA